MTRLTRSFAFAITLLLTASGARAQVSTVVLTAPYAPVHQAAVTAFGYYMSPYSGTVDGALTRLNCVDFFHDVWLGDVWQANKVNLGQAAGNLSLLNPTRDANAPYISTFGGSLGTVLDIYREMAWLTDQQPANPGLTPQSAMQTTAIQTAIWAIGNPGYRVTERWGVDALHNYSRLNTSDFNASSSDPYTTAYWINQAQVNALSSALVNSSYYYRFSVLTNVDLNAVHGAQEFIYSVPASEVEVTFVVTAAPEPSTFLFIASGLLGLAGALNVQRRRVRAVGSRSV